MIARLYRAGVTGGLSLVLGLVAFPVGSNRDWAWAPLSCVVAMLILITVAGSLALKWPAFANFGELRTPAFLMAFSLTWAAFQLVDLAPESWRNPLASLGFPGASPHAVTAAVAIDVPRGWEALMKLLTYVGVFWLAAAWGGRAKSARWLFVCIVAAATAYTGVALVGELILRAGGNRTEPFIGLTGPFVNRSHFAAYAAMAALVALSGALATFPRGHRRDDPFGVRLRLWLLSVSTSGGLLFAAFLVLSTGVLMSWSRGAAVSYIIAIAVVVALVTSGIVRWIALAAIGIVVVGGALYLPTAAGMVARMFDLSTDLSAGRTDLVEVALHGISMRPWLGWGLGSFDDLYAVFQGPTLRFRYDRAHNIYLETAFELGLPVAIAFFMAVGWLVGRCALGVRERSQDIDIPLAAVACAIMLGVHSLVDFPAEIPAVAVTFAAILGIGWAQSWSSRRGLQ